jgi:outer membrane protein assembly factor BamD (BamD/ComL family)
VRIPGFPVLVLAVLFAGACSSSVKIPEGTAPSAAKAEADALFADGRYARAARYYEAIVSEFPRTPEADQAEWLAAEAWFQDDDLSTAQELYQDYYTSHPLSNLGTLGERMYTIGVERYERGRGGLVGLGIFSTSERGLKALEWITQKLPNGTRADDAFFFIGKARMGAWQFEEAVLNFDQILNRYPQSEWTHEARFLRAESFLRTNDGPDYDRESLLRAQRDFEDYIRIVERSEALRTEYADRLKEAKAMLLDTNERLAEKSIRIADFYRSQERFEAERIYLEAAARRYPTTEAGKAAADRLAAPAPEEK